MLIKHFLSGRSISAEAVGLLLKYDWPGNVRELRQTLEVAAALAPAHEIQASDLPEEIRAAVAGPNAQARNESVRLISLKAAEREHILRVLDAVGNNKTRAARILGVHVDTLNRKLCK